MIYSKKLDEFLTNLPKDQFQRLLDDDRGFDMTCSPGTDTDGSLVSEIIENGVALGRSAEHQNALVFQADFPQVTVFVIARDEDEAVTKTEIRLAETAYLPDNEDLEN